VNDITDKAVVAFAAFCIGGCTPRGARWACLETLEATSDKADAEGGPVFPHGGACFGLMILE